MHRVAILGLLSALAMTGGCATATERAHMSASSLASEASEGARLADQIIHGRVRPVFARAHAQELRDDVNRVQKSVADNPTTGQKALLRRAGRLDRALGTIVVHPDSLSVARTTRTVLSQLATEISQDSR